MQPEVNTRSLSACAELVHRSSWAIWEAAEKAVAEAARVKEAEWGGDESAQLRMAYLAQIEAIRQRKPLVWKVFAIPGRHLRRRWRLAPAFPDGQLPPGVEPGKSDLTVELTDTAATIRGKLQALREPTPVSV